MFQLRVLDIKLLGDMLFALYVLAIKHAGILLGNNEMQCPGKMMTVQRWLLHDG